MSGSQQEMTPDPMQGREPAGLSGIQEYLASLKSSRRFGPQVVSHRCIAPQRASFATDPPLLPPALVRLLDEIGCPHLYSHQDKALKLIAEGRDIIVATPTASGKSMIYNLPVLSDLLGKSGGHSLYLFPLKALAQDQLKTLDDLANRLVLDKRCPVAALYDGDVSSYVRRRLREHPPAVLLSNPEMVHLSLLPYHQSWSTFLGQLKYVVIDEIHSYRGVLGSHMAWVMRRLSRIAAHYGATPQFISLSATIGNPQQLGSQLLGRTVELVDNSGAPTAERNMLLLNPWDSAAYTASQLLEAAMKRGLRTIVYTQSRKMTELIQLWTAPRLGDLASKLSAYRAGYLPEERREIEEGLFSGKLLGVVSTSALELGIDIGDLDLCLLVGYPGSIMATWQRGGRVGRKMRPSATILIANEDALDQHFMRHPEDFFRRTPESAVLNPANDTIMDQHLHCCAAELALTTGEELLDHPAVAARIDHLTRQGQLLQTASGERWVTSRKLPQRLISLRGGGSQLTIVDTSSGEIIGNIDISRAMKECHQGAIYLHRAQNYLVKEFQPGNAEILVEPLARPNYFTRPTVEKHTEILECLKTMPCLGVRLSFGRIRVREKVTGYQKRNTATQKLIASFSLEMPEQVIETQGVWLDIPAGVEELMQKEKLHFMGAIHALEHGMIAMLPMIALCDRNDIGGISCPLHDQTESASIFIYDGYPGGVGLCLEAYERFVELCQLTQRTITACDCDNGCPSCVHSPKCGSGNRPIDKSACIRLLQQIMDSKWQESADSHSPIQGSEAPKIVVEQQPQNAEAQPQGLEVLPARYGVFDLETIRSAAEVGGWHQASRMGVSLAVVYDSLLGDFVTYLEDEMERCLSHLEELDLVVGFNNKRFDNQVLSAYTPKDLSKLPNLDLLEEIQQALGYRLSLNSLAEHTLGEKKGGDGLQALQWYKEGRVDLIQKYCRKDVAITRDLLLYALEHGYLLFANKAGHTVRLPLHLEGVIARVKKKSATQ